MKKLYFYNKELNYSFEFSYTDLFFYNELDNKYYFLIEFERNTGERNRWLIGEFFFKKYQLFFNQDSKKIGIYTQNFINNSKNENNWINKNKWYLILIIILFFLLIGLAILIIFFIRNRPKRKKKANELVDDEYEYEINNDK